MEMFELLFFNFKKIMIGKGLKMLKHSKFLTENGPLRGVGGNG